MLYHNGFLDGFLNLHAFSRDGLIQFPLKGQQVHVGLRLGDQVSNLRAAHQWIILLGMNLKCESSGENHLTLCGRTLSAILRLFALQSEKNS